MPHHTRTYDLHRQGLLLAYPIEILPYEIRAKGLNVTFFGVSTNCEYTLSLYAKSFAKRLD